MNNILFYLRNSFNGRIINFLLRVFNKIYLKGSFTSWKNAKKISKDDYSSQQIFKKICYSFVKSFKSRFKYYERDGVLLKRNKNDNDNIISFLLEHKLEKKKIKILDVGGGTGSIYFKHKNFFTKNHKIKWFVFEQKKLVKFLNKQIQNKQIYYVSKLNEKFDVALFQSSLQYFEKPYVLLEKIVNLEVKFIIIDEFVCTKNLNEIITIQIVPKKIYKARYPVYIFSKNKLINFFKKKGFQLINYKNCRTGVGGYNYKCMIFKKNLYE